jgi:hypothetical protein
MTTTGPAGHGRSERYCAHIEAFNASLGVIGVSYDWPVLPMSLRARHLAVHELEIPRLREPVLAAACAAHR